MIVKSKVYKGIEYVQLSELPREQQEMFSNSVNKDLTIKILVNGKLLSDCLQFKDYTVWYENIFKGTNKTEGKVESKPVKAKASPKLELKER